MVDRCDGNQRQAEGGRISSAQSLQGRAGTVGLYFPLLLVRLLFGAQHVCLERGKIEEPEEHDVVELDFRMHGDNLVSPRTARPASSS